jgi:hypothetical protein
MAAENVNCESPSSIQVDPRLEPVIEMASHIRTELIPHLQSPQDRAAQHYAAAALARCNRLLLSMLDLRKAGFPDVLGVMLRCLVECWYLGMLAILAPDETHDMIRAAHKWQLERLDDSTWEGVGSVTAQIDQAAQKMNWKVVSNRVGSLLAELGQPEGQATATSTYETIYRGESLLSVHAGAASLMGHFQEIDAATFSTREIRHEPDDGFSRILAAAPFVGSLASCVASEYGLGNSEVDRISDLIPLDWDSN